MRSRLNPTTVLSVAAALSAAALLFCAPDSFAGDGGNGTGGNSAPPAKTSGSGHGDQISAVAGSHITIRSNSGGGVPLASSDASYAPVPCWYEPRFTPKEYEKFFRQGMQGWDTGKQYVMPLFTKLESEQYNIGKKGLWWQINYNDSMGMAAVDDCPYHDDAIWVPTGDPTPPPGAVTPEELSKMAYSATKLPAPNVALSPPNTRQVVNLPTYVSFSRPLRRVWVTAALDFRGVDIAATTVATPVALRIDAGTAEASPRTCTYALTAANGAYRVNSSDAACDITYRRSSGAGTYPLQAQITWRVTWTPSRDPNGPAAQPALPDGLSSSTQSVTVKEIQTVDR